MGKRCKKKSSWERSWEELRGAEKWGRSWKGVSGWAKMGTRSQGRVEKMRGFPPIGKTCLWILCNILCCWKLPSPTLCGFYSYLEIIFAVFAIRHDWVHCTRVCMLWHSAMTMTQRQKKTETILCSYFSLPFRRLASSCYDLFWLPATLAFAESLHDPVALKLLTQKACGDLADTFYWGTSTSFGLTLEYIRALEYFCQYRCTYFDETWKSALSPWVSCGI